MNSEAIKYIAKITDLQTRAEVGSQKHILIFPLLFQVNEAELGGFFLDPSICGMLASPAFKEGDSYFCTRVSGRRGRSS